MVRILRILILIVFAFSLFACNGETPTSEPSTPIGDQNGRDIAWVDWDASEVVVRESFPMQVAVILRGDVPSPCHEIQWEIADPNEDNEIHITVWSIVDPGANCASLIDAFEEQISVGNFEEHGYSVWVNEMQVGEF